MSTTLEKLHELRAARAATYQASVEALAAHQKAVALDRQAALVLAAALDDFLGIAPSPTTTGALPTVPAPAPAEPANPMAPPGAGSTPATSATSTPEPSTTLPPSPTAAVVGPPSTLSGHNVSGASLTGR
jgi:hypothetical protein